MNETLRLCVRGDAILPVLGSIPNGAGTMVENVFSLSSWREQSNCYHFYHPLLLPFRPLPIFFAISLAISPYRCSRKISALRNGVGKLR